MKALVQGKKAVLAYLETDAGRRAAVHPGPGHEASLCAQTADPQATYNHRGSPGRSRA